MKAIQKGFSPRMRHLSRVHKVSLDLLHDELCQRDSRMLTHVGTKDNLADVFTKDLPAPAFNELVKRFSQIENSERKV
jgi:hypothetical protein